MKLLLSIFLCIITVIDIYAQGVTKNGNNTLNSNDFINQNGQIVSLPSLNKNGQICTVPSLTTLNASSINCTSALSGGNAVSDGGTTITARGICWSTSSNPTIDLLTKTVGVGTVGTFSSTMTDLSVGTTYYVRSYASNAKGTGYGNEISFSTLNVPNTVTSATNTPSGTQIVWNWNSVTDATGYKWNTSNDYDTAEDMGTFTSKTETGLTVGNEYTRYVWAYNNCGHSSVTALNQLLVYIGASCGGGIVFYIDGTGKHGLISATVDQSTSAIYGCRGWSNWAYGTDIGTGQGNTSAIVSNCAPWEQSTLAAEYCDNLVLNGYSDWYLPSKDELNQMYVQHTAIGINNGQYYWSSSAFNTQMAYMQNLTSGYGWATWKDVVEYVRAIRSF